MTQFKRNLVIGFGISLLLLIVSSVASFISIKNLLYSARMVNHTNEVGRKVESVLSILKDAESGQRGFLLTDDERFLDSYNGSYAAVTAVLNEVKQLTTDNRQQQADCEQLKVIAQRRISYLT